MNRVMIILVKLVCLPLIYALTAAAATYGQQAKVEIGNLAQLEAKAAEVVDVNLDERAIQMAAKVLSGKRSPDEAKIKELITGLKGVYVKVFEFDHAGEYAEADLNPVRTQLTAPGWTRIVGVRSKREGQRVEVYLMGEVDKVQGLTIISAEPRELVIVNIVGPIDLEKLSELEGNFGIPRLGIDFGRKPRKE